MPATMKAQSAQSLDGTLITCNSLFSHWIAFKAQNWHFGRSCGKMDGQRKKVENQVQKR